MPFRNETRRQSFGGITLRPTLGIQTMPLGGHDHRSPIGLYNKIGIARRSSAAWATSTRTPQLHRPPSARVNSVLLHYWGKNPVPLLMPTLVAPMSFPVCQRKGTMVMKRVYILRILHIPVLGRAQVLECLSCPERPSRNSLSRIVILWLTDIHLKARCL